MAGSVREREYDVELTIKTSLYEEEIEDVLREVLEQYGIEIEHVSVAGN